MKLYINPHPNLYQENGQGSGGIWRVINAQAKYLSSYGVEIVNSVAEAEVVAVHAGSLMDSQELATTNKPVVAHNHGLYWTADFNWSKEFWQYNLNVIETLRRACLITVPSEWVAVPIRRDMKANPYVIPHGINIEDFELQREHEDFVLWGKPRVDVVSDPKPVNELAATMPNTSFVTTFGRPANNVFVIGAKSFSEFQKVLSKAAIWLATSRETGDIASREAMAMGIPVVGWNHGATAELIKHKETGWLAPLNDYNNLADGIRYCLQHRDRIGQAARAHVTQHCQWRDIMAQYAAVYQVALDQDQYPVEISVVVPNFNYAHFLPACIKSLAEQSLQDFEIIVVDDGSTDNSLEVIANLEKEYPHLNIKVVAQSNQGLPAALNAGHKEARGRYIVNLDADNIFTPDALQLLSEALDSKPWLDVASGGLAVFTDNDNYRTATDWPWGRVNVHEQLAHYNQLHSSSMMRARSIKRLGGYRARSKRNEDGEWWCRAMSAGLRFEQVTNEPTLVYRWHDKNKSKAEGGEHDPEGLLSWNHYYPWRHNPNITPFAMTGDPPNGSWAVRSYGVPHVAVCIPCGPGHEKFLPDALDSIVGQTFQNVECIVANDTGQPLDVASMGHPWARVVDGPFGGPGPARNAAIAAAKAPFIVPLDADDMLDPNAIEQMYSTWLEWPEDIVYMDCHIADRPEERRYYHSGRWSWDKIKREAIYQVTIFYPKQWWEAVGGYPDDMGWEDWLFGVKLHLAGIGATYLEEPWGVYRHWTGYGQAGRDTEGFGTPEWQEKLDFYYQWIADKEEEMGCCPGGKGGRVASTNPHPQSRPVPQHTGELKIVYRGDRQGGFGLNSRAVRGRKYFVFPNEPFDVPAGDEWILRMGDFEEYNENTIGSEEANIPMALPPIPTIEIKQPPPIVEATEVIGAPPIGKLPERMPIPTPVESIVQHDRDEPQLALPVNAPLDVMESLTGNMIESLGELGIATVAELAFDLTQNGGRVVRQAKRIGPKRVNMITEEMFA